jgi:hypothetical protein
MSVAHWLAVRLWVGGDLGFCYKMWQVGRGTKVYSNWLFLPQFLQPNLPPQTTAPHHQLNHVQRIHVKHVDAQVISATICFIPNFALCFWVDILSFLWSLILLWFVLYFLNIISLEISYCVTQCDGGRGESKISQKWNTYFMSRPLGPH